MKDVKTAFGFERGGKRWWRSHSCSYKEIEVNWREGKNDAARVKPAHSR
jgi:hypothetical protein